MSEPTTIDEIPWGEPVGDRLQAAAPRKCRHPRARRVPVVPRPDDPPGMLQGCGLCGHIFDPATQRRGRAVRKYGKNAELQAARRLGLEPRGTSRDPEDAGGAMDPAVLQSKTGPGFASVAWIRELEALEMVAKGRPRILLAAEKPGRGSRKGGDRNARRLVVMFEDEFQRLTGLDARRRNLEVIADVARRLISEIESEDGSPLEDEMRDALEILFTTPAR